MVIIFTVLLFLIIVECILSSEVNMVSVFLDFHIVIHQEYENWITPIAESHVESLETYSKAVVLVFKAERIMFLGSV